ncbi:type I DNA topoisomerase [Acidipila sp. EB88]|uniref:type I DNA topoisomerase n=1 Tax=Acidipila sp. EB88 TaxID=2305226 RepID=UPI001F0322CD|nr:type I DNA topoisomerase [Acidipila sp. EB88]
MIVESPNKVRKIKDILGAGWDVAASVGHIRDLPVKELGITMPGYQPQYELSSRGADVVKTLRARAARADVVYLATDPDREGEAIAWHLAEALKLKGAQRVTFDAITPDVIRRALTQPRSVDRHLVHAQEARRVLDRLVGYQVSPVLSRQTARRGLSAGRVQSPAVRMVVDREREIDAFVEVRHFGAELSFDSNSWRAQWETAPFLKKSTAAAKANEENEAPEARYILDEALATRAAACRACIVLTSANRIAKQPPPPPFTTSTLLQAASIQLRWKPDVTAQVAQRLFEAGLITYHRTDSQNFSAEALKEVRGFAAKRSLPLPPSARTWRARGNAQEAHEAIRPTHFESEQAGDDPAQQQLYRLIWLRAVASQLADAEWSVNTTRLQSPPQPAAGEERFTFKAEGRVLVVPGWKALTAKDDADEDEDARDGESCGKVPVLAVGAEPRAETGRVLHKKTQPPPRYTQAGLIKKLESMGIGRPSTYPAILKNVQTRGYLEDDRKYLRPTELGMVVVDALITRFSFVEYAFTRDLEQQLDDIAEGKAEYLSVVGAADERLQRELLALSRAPRMAAPPGSAPIWKPSSTPASAGRPAAAVVREAELPPKAKTAKKSTRKTTAGVGTERPTPRTGKATAAPADAPVRKPRKQQAPGAATTESAPIPCPVCKVGSIVLRSEDAKFYGCSQFTETNCRFSIWRTVAGRPLSEVDVAALCRDGHTGKLTGFMSKAGRPFEAALVLNKEGRVEFSFQPRS